MAWTLAGCQGDPAGPGPGRYRVIIHAGQNQYGNPGAALPVPLKVLVTTGNDQPAPDVVVRWNLLEGPGGFLFPDSTRTDSAGFASTVLSLGPDTGLHRVEATVPGAVLGESAVFEARAVHTPEIHGIHPATAQAGTVVTITGQHFLPGSPDNAVTFGGMRGAVISATSTELQVVVPRCVPERQVPVVARLGSVASEPVTIDVVDGGVEPLSLQPGQVARIPVESGLACLALPSGPVGTEYLVVPQNATHMPRRPMPFELVALTPQDILTWVGEPLIAAGRQAGDVAAEWEAFLREYERRLLALSPPRPAPRTALAEAVAPAVGDRRSFNVINRDQQFTTVVAEVRHVSERAILYADVNAPQQGFTPADYQQFGAMFDDPIYSQIANIFGEPSDVDGNGRIVILFTPVVNELTPRGSSGYVAGFFYGLDLLVSQPRSNGAELFYSLVPDPAGLYGDPRTRAQLLETVPPVLAHEFEHMVHFNQRMLESQAGEPEALWLSEGLAHMAEEVVAQELVRRGETARARNFRQPNLIRACLYLEKPNRVSLIAPEIPGTLQQRGAAWLYVQYLSGHHGAALLGALTRTARSGTDNVTTAVGASWNELFGDWSVALWATGAPDLAGAQLEPRYTFADFPLRSELQGTCAGGFPLRPDTRAFADFAVNDTLPSASAGYTRVRAESGDGPVNIGFHGEHHGAYAGTLPQVSVLRVR